MLGTLFGTILGTIVERQSPKRSSFAHLTGKQSEIEGCLRQLLACLGLKDSPSNEPAVVSANDDSQQDTTEELNELKRELAETGFVEDSRHRTIDLISQCTSFLHPERGSDYYILPYSGLPVFDGLISFLTRKAGGNPHDNGVIVADGTAYNTDAAYQPRNAANLGSDSVFYSANRPGQCLGYDFKDARVVVTHYIIRSTGNAPGWRHLRSWVLEGSKDKETWQELDRRIDEGGLNDANAVRCFKVKSIVEARFIRIQATGQDWAGTNHIYLKAFELFGGLRSLPS
jgi:hypothetical protein